MQKLFEKIIFLIISLGLIVYGVSQVNAYKVEMDEIENVSNNVPFQKGMSFTTWNDFSFNKEWVKAEFQKMKAIGVEWIAINHWWWQDYLNSTKIHQGPWSDGYTNMTECFLYAKSIGLHIMYKPMLNVLKTYEWRSYIIYNYDWMGNYTAWMVENAKAAEAGEVEILCFGTEMGNMQVHSEGVREMISQIRTVFSGLLTYSANHDSWMFIDWYDAIDIIGISMYTMMTTDWDPTVNQLTKVWNGMYSELEDAALKWKKPILFTEIGIQAMDGSNLIPNDNQISQQKDISEMENFYQSLFNSKIWNAPWFKGAYWWIWDQAQASDSSLKSFNPVIIQDVIKTEYSKEHVVAASTFHYFRTLFPLIICSFIIILIISQDSAILLPEFFNLKLSKEDHLLKNSTSESPLNLYRSDIILGLLLGSFIGLIWIDFTLNIFNVIQKSFSYAIILQLSLTETISTFMILLILSCLAGFLINRFYPRISLVIAFSLMLFTPYFALTGNSELFFIRTFLSLITFFIIAGFLLLFFIKIPINNFILIIGVTLTVLTSNFILILEFESLSSVFIGIPIGLALILSQKVPQSVVTQKIENIQQNQEIHLKMILLGQSLLAGMLIPFGNSNMNLVKMNPLSIAYHYIPAVLVGFGLIILYLEINWRKIEKMQLLISRWLNDKTFISLILIIGIIAIPFVIFGYISIPWAILSGNILIFFIGMMIKTFNDSFNKKLFGRNYLYLLLFAIFFVLGFIINGIKGLFVVTLTFLVIKDGQILRRDPTIDPVPSFNVPMLLDGIILAVILIIAAFLLFYIIIKNRIQSFKKIG